MTSRRPHGNPRGGPSHPYPRGGVLTTHGTGTDASLGSPLPAIHHHGSRRPCGPGIHLDGPLQHSGSCHRHHRVTDLRHRPRRPRQDRPRLLADRKRHLRSRHRLPHRALVPIAVRLRLRVHDGFPSGEVGATRIRGRHREEEPHRIQEAGHIGHLARGDVGDRSIPRPPRRTAGVRIRQPSVTPSGGPSYPSRRSDTDISTRLPPWGAWPVS